MSNEPISTEPTPAARGDAGVASSGPAASHIAASMTASPATSANPGAGGIHSPFGPLDATGLPCPAELSRFPVIIALPVQWGEQDLYGHVNNIVYFRWFESARVAYGDRLDFPRLLVEQQIGPILAAVNCNYRKQITFPDTVLIGARISRLGRSSLTMDHAIYSLSRKELSCDGSSTVVLFHYEQQRPIAIPEEMRARIQALEGRDLTASAGK